MSRVPGPSTIRSGLAKLRRIKREGGPKRLRVTRVGRPKGIFLPSSEVEFEVVTESGDVVRADAEVPVPFPYAWGYRLARRLGLPLASSLEPEDLSFELGIPGWAWPGSPSTTQ